MADCSRGGAARLVRLDGDEFRLDVQSTTSAHADAETLPDHCETAKLLARLIEIDDACFPRDAGGLASARAWASSRRLRRATRLAAAYEDAADAAELRRRKAESSPDERTVPPAACEPRTKTSPNERRVVAFASFIASSMCLEITKVACDPSARRRGHARAAVAAILAEAWRSKKTRVALRVEKANEAAVSLYASLGFREDTSRARAHEGYYGAGRNGAVYELLLEC